MASAANTPGKTVGKTTAARQRPPAQVYEDVVEEFTQFLTTTVAKRAADAANDALDRIIHGFRIAPPLTRIAAERAGVSGGLVKEIAKSMGVSYLRMFEVIGLPKATAAKRAATNTAVTGAPGQAALGIVRLLGIAQAMAENSDAPEAAGFDTAKWLGDWIERPQPALGGRKPADMLDTPTGVDTVAKLLGAIESGVYL